MRPAARQGAGCAFLLGAGLISCVFLLLNGLLVRAGYAWLSVVGPAWLRHAKFAQICLFVGPVVLLFVEWWAVDLVLQTLSSARTPWAPEGITTKDTKSTKDGI